MGRVRVKLNREWCISSGACVVEAPKLFELDEQGIVSLRVRQIDAADEPALNAAAAACPAAVIEIEDDEAGEFS